MTRARAVVVRVAFALALMSCDVGRALVASNGDLEAYRTFRIALAPGTRLARAQAYLDTHPKGAWSGEVRAVFDEEEPAYFEAAKASRSRARDYLVDLPRGPHAEAAVSLLLAFDAKVDDVETARLLRDARNTEVLLERAGNQRRSVGEHVLAFLALITDRAIYGAPFRAAPADLLSALDGPARRTWGVTPQRRTEDLFFSLPTTRERESRIAVVSYELVTNRNVADGPVESARITGPALFLRWLEADEMRARDDDDPNARRAAVAHAVEVLGGALEARLPKGRCDAPNAANAFFTRACDGLVVTATLGDDASAPDALVVRASPR